MVLKEGEVLQFQGYASLDRAPALRWYGRNGSWQISKNKKSCKSTITDSHLALHSTTSIAPRIAFQAYFRFILIWRNVYRPELDVSANFDLFWSSLYMIEYAGLVSDVETMGFFI